MNCEQAILIWLWQLLVHFKDVLICLGAWVSRLMRFDCEKKITCILRAYDGDVAMKFGDSQLYEHLFCPVCTIIFRNVWSWISAEQINIFGDVSLSPIFYRWFASNFECHIRHQIQNPYYKLWKLPELLEESSWEN